MSAERSFELLRTSSLMRYIVDPVAPLKAKEVALVVLQKRLQSTTKH